MPLSDLFAAPRALTAEDLLTEGQRTGLQYSRDRYADGSYQVNGGRDPSVTSFMGAIGDAPGGGYFNFPTFWDGRVIDPRMAQQRALQWEAANGKQFARAASPESSGLGEMLTHLVMDKDSQAVLATPEAQARLRAMLTGGR
jgi:hypothetical protein